MSWPRPSFRATIALVLALVATSPRPADAGGGVYDPKTKSFALNYIYLDIPSGTMDQNVVLLSPARTRPTADQQRVVNDFLGLVSKRLSEVTSGRASISNLSEVSDVHKADVVISLTGVSGPTVGGAWAGLHGFQRGGTANIYYHSLETDPSKDDVVNTVVHELCHYFFGLPDEYPVQPSSQRNCPLVAPGSKCCLMDNYHAGYLGRLCRATDHNPAAPGAAGYQTVEPRDVSCEDLLAKFFKPFNVEPDSGAAAGTPTASGGKTMKMTAEQSDSALKLARDAFSKLKARRNGPLSAQDRKELRNHIIAGLFDTLKGQVKNFDLATVASDLVGSLVLGPLGVPPGLQLIAKPLMDEAIKLARGAFNRDGKADDIELKLLDFAKKATKNAVGAAPLGAEDFAYIGELAKQAASGTLPDQPENLDQLRDELMIEIARTLNSSANESDVPGAAYRGTNLDRIVKGVQQLSRIPNRSLGSRFGHRRTVLIVPPVLVYTPLPEGFTIDTTPTQGDRKANYNDLRRESETLFAQLIDRTRVVAFSAASASPRPGQTESTVLDIRTGLTDLASLDVMNVFEIDRKEGERPGTDKPLIESVLDQRRARIFDILANMSDKIERDLIENIVVLVPPGGIPGEFADAINSLGEQFIGKADLRVDVALVGSARIPAELRDIVYRSGGSILTVTGIDEVGAVTQRLAGEQTQGTWITIPQQDMLLVDSKTGEVPADAGPFLFQRLRDTRRPHLVKSDAESRVVLKSFYLDDSNDYELIVGLSQPLSIAGLSKVVGPDGKQKVLERRGNWLKDFPEPTLRLMAGELTDPEAIKAYEKDKPIVFAQTREIKLVRTKSSSRVLVFNIPATQTGTGTGWFTPVLTLFKGNLADVALTEEVDKDKDGKEKKDKDGKNLMRPIATARARAARPNHDPKVDDVINFTFSVGTSSSKAQLSANLIQDGSEVAPATPAQGGTRAANKAVTATQLGTIASDKAEAVITAILSAGSAVVGAQVSGFAQQITSGGEAAIDTSEVKFNDRGESPDLVKDDGVYSARILLERRRTTPSEYRVFIEGRTVADTRFVPSGEILLKPGDDPKDVEAAAKNQADRKAPGFQRATSIHFSVPANTSD